MKYKHDPVFVKFRNGCHIDSDLRMRIVPKGNQCMYPPREFDCYMSIKFGDHEFSFPVKITVDIFGIVVESLTQCDFTHGLKNFSAQESVQIVCSKGNNKHFRASKVIHVKCYAMSPFLFREATIQHRSGCTEGMAT